MKYTKPEDLMAEARQLTEFHGIIISCWFKPLFFTYIYIYIKSISILCRKLLQVNKKEKAQYKKKWARNSVQFSSVAQSCLTLCDPMSHSTPGLPVHHQLPESTQTAVHWVGDAIQPSHPLASPSPLALNLSQHQGLFQWVSSLYQVAKVLEF